MGTLQQEAIAASREVQSHALRPSLKTLIEDLSYRVEGKDDRSLLGYYARQIHAQFFSFLRLNERREELGATQVPIVVPTLKDEELALLREGHSLLFSLVRLCAEAATGGLVPVATIMPYPDFKRVQPSLSCTEALGQAVAGSVAAQVLRKYSFVVGQSQPGFVAKAISQWRDEVRKAGTKGAPPGLFECGLSILVR